MHSDSTQRSQIHEPKRRNIDRKMKQLEEDMEEISEEQDRIKRVQEEMKEKLQEMESECRQIKKETEFMSRQNANTQLRLSIMLKILKAREENDYAKADDLTRSLLSVFQNL